MESFQEYKQAIELLREAYYANATSEMDIQRANIQLLSDSNFMYGILKTVQLQVIANKKGVEKKNTFVQRYSYR